MLDSLMIVSISSLKCKILIKIIAGNTEKCSVIILTSTLQRVNSKKTIKIGIYVIL